ncbi:hypothetical protein EDD15DRAFT_1901663 [Pisolithus albus]|nr:hypothetical protein EDD15DRAFT_1901663 [Pisolithus albus]
MYNSDDSRKRVWEQGLSICRETYQINSQALNEVGFSPNSTRETHFRVIEDDLRLSCGDLGRVACSTCCSGLVTREYGTSPLISLTIHLGESLCFHCSRRFILFVSAPTARKHTTNGQWPTRLPGVRWTSVRGRVGKRWSAARMVVNFQGRENTVPRSTSIRKSRDIIRLKMNTRVSRAWAWAITWRPQRPTDCGNSQVPSENFVHTKMVVDLTKT